MHLDVRKSADDALYIEKKVPGIFQSAEHICQQMLLSWYWITVF